jgi:hypothetical protein
MTRASDDKIVLVVRPTRLDELIARFNTAQQVGDYLLEHKTYYAALAEAERRLSGQGHVQRLERRFLANFVFGAADLVVVLGQDGLVANTLKYLDGQPVVGVNPDPGRWDGVLLPFQAADLDRIVAEQRAGWRQAREVVMAQATLNTGQRLYAVNDLFIGARSHVSARYEIAIGRRREAQSSSGIIVSTGLGSTGWLRSVYAGWRAAAAFLAPQLALPELESGFAWDAPRLAFTVREPYPSRASAATIGMGGIDAAHPLRILSAMPENGVIFSDGIEADYLDFNSGTQARIAIADKRGRLVV